VTLNSNGTRERILGAAEVVFADMGYHDALVEEIGRRTSVSKGGLYFHFPSKEHLFFAVLDRLAGKLVRSAEQAGSGDGTAMEHAERALQAVLTALSRRRRLARLLLVQGYSMGNSFERKRVEIFDRFAGVVRTRLDEAVAAGEIEPLDTELVSRVWLGAINELVVHWLYSGGPSPAERLHDISQVLRRSTGLSASFEATT
jgi:AcrR family transcriptional regulator